MSFITLDDMFGFVFDVTKEESEGTVVKAQAWRDRCAHCHADMPLEYDDSQGVAGVVNDSNILVCIRICADCVTIETRNDDALAMSVDEAVMNGWTRPFPS